MTDLRETIPTTLREVMSEAMLSVPHDENCAAFQYEYVEHIAVGRSFNSELCDCRKEKQP